MELTTYGNLCWIREIIVKLYSNKYNVKPLVYGSRDIDGNYLTSQLNIDVKGSKYISALKDNGVISISNLDYEDISRIIMGEYYNIEIFAGYKSQSPLCIFRGEVAYISDKIVQNKDHTCYIIYAPKLVAKWSRQRMNLQLNSGINIYAAYKYICMKNNIPTSGLSVSLRNQFLHEVQSNYGTPASLIDQINEQTSSNVISIDESIENNIIDCATIKDKRQIKINSDTINFTKGNPTISKDGLKISLLPTFQFQPGDIIIIDNAIIDISESNLSGAQTGYKANYMDPDGAYMIIQIDYDLQNRGINFELNIQARALNIIKNIIGGNT